MTHGSNGRHQAGGLLALLASGSLLLAAGAAVARPDCADWNTYQFFEQATAADVAHCLSEGADPNARDENGYTPLHRMGVRALGNDEVTMALLNETPAVVKVLVDAGADLEARDARGWTPLHAATILDPVVVKYLLDAGAAPNARDARGWTPLHAAVSHGFNLDWNSRTMEPILAWMETGTVKLLVDAGADPNARAELGLTPLHVAARNNKNPLEVEALLDAGADPKAKADGGIIPVELIPDDSPLQGTDVYWRLNEARYR